MAQWGHVRVFSPWKYNVDKAASSLLEKAEWKAPDPEKLPLGSKTVSDYLEPLAEMRELHSRIHFGADVLSVARPGFDKMKSEGRKSAPFQVSTNRTVSARRSLLQLLIDVSGTYGEPNPLGANGIEASRKAPYNSLFSTKSRI